MNTYILDDKLVPWASITETPLQQTVRARIKLGEELKCFVCQMQWTIGPYMWQTSDVSIYGPDGPTFEYHRPYTDVARRGVIEVAKGAEWPPHLVCKECGEAWIEAENAID